MKIIDTTCCPICLDKMSNLNLRDTYLHAVDNTSDYIRRTCAKNLSHVLQIFTDKKSKDIHLLKVSLNNKCDRIILIDYLNSKSTIVCNKMGKSKNIDIPKVLNIDFPNMLVIKQIVDKYILLS